MGFEIYLQGEEEIVESSQGERPNNQIIRCATLIGE